MPDTSWVLISIYGMNEACFGSRYANQPFYSLTLGSKSHLMKTGGSACLASLVHLSALGDCGQRQDFSFLPLALKSSQCHVHL